MGFSEKMSRRKQPRPYRLQDDEDSCTDGKNSICENPSSLVNLLNGNGVQKQNRKFISFSQQINIYFPNEKKQEKRTISIVYELLCANGELVELDVTASPLTVELTKIVFYACSFLREHVERDFSTRQLPVAIVISHNLQHSLVARMKLEKVCTRHFCAHIKSIDENVMENMAFFGVASNLSSKPFRILMYYFHKNLATTQLKTFLNFVQ